jgi:glycosyltransferase involved in cell wall biosynthesis
MYLLRCTDRIFVQTEPEYLALRERGIPAEKLVLQGMGVDANACTGGSREKTRAAWGADASTVVIGHLANLSEEKGSVDLLRAAQLAWQQGQRFLIVLAGPQMPNFRRCWQGYSPAGPVRCLGVLTEEQKRDFFAGIDLFALPSRSDSFGLVLLEAWANGVPSVAYRAGGVPGVVRHEQDGLLVHCGDVAGLAEALAVLIDNPGLRRRLGQAGQERTQRDYRWEDKLRRVEEVYEELASSTTGCRKSRPFAMS